MLPRTIQNPYPRGSFSHRIWSRHNNPNNPLYAISKAMRTRKVKKEQKVNV